MVSSLACIVNKPPMTESNNMSQLYFLQICFTHTNYEDDIQHFPTPHLMNKPDSGSVYYSTETISWQRSQAAVAKA